MDEFNEATTLSYKNVRSFSFTHMRARTPTHGRRLARSRCSAYLLVRGFGDHSGCMALASAWPCRFSSSSWYAPPPLATWSGLLHQLVGLLLITQCNAQSVLFIYILLFAAFGVFYTIGNLCLLGRYVLFRFKRGGCS
jgi:hypothetical protein